MTESDSAIEAEPRCSRRAALRAVGGGVAAGSALGVAPAGTRAQSDGTDLASWFENTSNYDGVVDRTGQSEVTVDVGVEANGGYYGYGPAAVRVSTGTTVVWKWTGDGSYHNVVAEDGSFSSQQAREAGHTYSQTFEAAGTLKYYCTPHEMLGMKGVVVVEG